MSSFNSPSDDFSGLRPSLYSVPKSLEEANRMTPYLHSILRSVASSWADSLIAASNLNEAIDAVTKDNAGDLEVSINLEILKDKLNSVVDRLNGYVSECELLNVDLVSVSEGWIGVVGRHKSEACMLLLSQESKGFSHYMDLYGDISSRSSIERPEEFDMSLQWKSPSQSDLGYSA